MSNTRCHSQPRSVTILQLGPAPIHGGPSVDDSPPIQKSRGARQNAGGPGPPGPPPPRTLRAWSFDSGFWAGCVKTFHCATNLGHGHPSMYLPSSSLLNFGFSEKLYHSTMPHSQPISDDTYIKPDE